MNTENIIKMPKRFDYACNNEFIKALAKIVELSKFPRVVLDCSEMKYIDSVGVGLIIMGYKRAQAAGRTLEIINLTPTARAILELSNIQKMLTLDE